MTNPTPRTDIEALHEHSLAEALFTHAPLGMIILDHHASIRKINPFATVLLGADDTSSLVGRSFFDVLTKETPEVRSAVVEALRGGDSAGARFKRADAGRTLRHCDMTVAPLRDPSGKVAGAQVFLADVTEQAQMYESILHTEKLSSLGETVAGVAHELNNPLTGILGYAQLLLGVQTDEKVRTRLEQIAAEAQRCRKIVQGLLGFARHVESEKGFHYLNAMVTEMVMLRDYQMRVDGIDVQLKLNPDLPQLKVDRPEMQRVFLNIINNAHQALLRVSDRKRSLIVETAEGDGYVSVGFTDNGPGIAPEHITKIFDPFFTTKPQGEGTGLGLSISYGVVREHGGQIQVDSTVGKGSTFTIILPAKTDRSSALHQ